MVTIYQNYDDEPKDIFLSLPEKLACSFYALEMDSYTADIEFFEQLLPKQGTFLELGCGTGRIAKQVAKTNEFGRFVVGIDISVPMLQLVTSRSDTLNRSSHYCCMDMTELAFSRKFDAILIAYNTLNLLDSEERIIKCLRGCRHSLKPGGKLLVQLFIPTKDFIQQKKTFQFQVFDRPGGGKIIKEILKTYEAYSQSIHIEERFRVRPMQNGMANEDWQKSYTIAGFSADQWLTFFYETGFVQKDIYGDYTGGEYHKSTSPTLLATFTL